MKHFVASLILMAFCPAFAWAEPVRICEDSPGGSIIVAHIYSEPDRVQAAILERFPLAECWEADDSMLPARTRPDPRDSSTQLAQRHRWRRVGQAVIVDPTVKQPQATAIRREYARLFPPARWAELVATPLGSALDRAVRDGRWADVRAALHQAGPGQPLTGSEIAQLLAIGDDYEADLR